MALYDGVAAVAREVSKKYDGVSGVAREVPAAYDGVSGVAREYFKSGTPIGSLAVGSTVYMKVNGVSKAFIVVNQGRPSTAYDTSCDGTWLLMTDIYTSRVWDSSDNNYANSDVHSYLNGTFLNLFSSTIKSAIKQVLLPYSKGTGSSGSLATGSNGISTKAFLLSYAEVGYSSHSYARTEGAVLGYFKGASNSKRIAKLDGTAGNWALRSPRIGNTTSAWAVISSGASEYGLHVAGNIGIRPCIILPSTQTVDDSFNVIA